MLATAVLALAALGTVGPCEAALPREVARAFLDARIPLTAVGAYVQEVGAARPRYVQQPSKPMNPASTMKLVTTYAALELLRPDFRWRTEVYAAGPIRGGTLDGDLVIKGSGDPKITLEQFEALVRKVRAGISTIRGDLVLDRSAFAALPHDPAAFDAEPLKPYNVGPDALLLNFKSVRIVFSPNARGDATDVRLEPALDNVALRRAPVLGGGDCDDWKRAVAPSFVSLADRAEIDFAGTYPAACGERDWYVALLDHTHYALALFARAWKDAGGRFAGGVRDGIVPRDAKLVATLDSPPLYDAVRDINKLSNNVMARQLFLTLAAVANAPPATPDESAKVVRDFLAQKKLRFPELVLENGSGLSRRERISASSMARLLASADASTVRADYVSSLAVAATDGTVRRRFASDDVADRAFLKTGTLEGVRAIAGFVYGAGNRRFIVVCLVNHPNAAAAQPALDLLVERVYHDALSR